MAIAPQQTLRSAASCQGIGLHCGQPVTMTLHPAAPDSGIVFRRSDADAEIRADWRNSVESALSTVLSNREGVHVATVEHLLAALAGMAVHWRQDPTAADVLTLAMQHSDPEIRAAAGIP